MSSTAADELILALATYRITKFVIDDQLTEPLRTRITARFGSPDDSYVSYLITCPWCVSIYAGTALSLARMMMPTPWKVLASALASSAVTGIMAEREADDF